jgi:hypothetical protein
MGKQILKTGDRGRETGEVGQRILHTGRGRGLSELDG